MAIKFTKPFQTVQKAVSPKPAKVGKQQPKTMGVMSKPKTKKAKPPSTVKGTKLTAMARKSTVKGAPISKRMAVKKTKAK